MGQSKLPMLHDILADMGVIRPIARGGSDVMDND